MTASRAAAQQQLPTPKTPKVPETSVTMVREDGVEETGLRERSPEMPAGVRPVEAEPSMNRMRRYTPIIPAIWRLRRRIKNLRARGWKGC